VSNALKFRYDDGKTFLNWEIGESVDNAVWISVFLILVVTFNMFPVRVRMPRPAFDDASAHHRLVLTLSSLTGVWRA
jgi:hypothetical protein